MLAARGALVAVFARSASAREIAARHRERMLAVDGDVSRSATRSSGSSRRRNRASATCDILVNSAGMIDPKTLIEVTPEEWDRMFAVNVRGDVSRLAARAAGDDRAARRRHRQRRLDLRRPRDRRSFRAGSRTARARPR